MEYSKQTEAESRQDGQKRQWLKITNIQRVVTDNVRLFSSQSGHMLDPKLLLDAQTVDVSRRGSPVLILGAPRGAAVSKCCILRTPLGSPWDKEMFLPYFE